MMLSTKGRYGLRALVDLAAREGDGAVSISSIAQRQDISEGYLEQLMAKLRRAGFVKSTRGAYGGYELARPPEGIYVGDVLRALEGNISPVDCPGLLGGCTDAGACVTKKLWKRINDGVSRIVGETTLQSLIEEPNGKGAGAYGR